MKVIGKTQKKNVEYIVFIYFLMRKIQENSQKDLNLRMNLDKKLIHFLNITIILRTCLPKKLLLLKMKMSIVFLV